MGKRASLKMMLNRSRGLFFLVLVRTWPDGHGAMKGRGRERGDMAGAGKRCGLAAVI